VIAIRKNEIAIEARSYLGCFGSDYSWNCGVEGPTDDPAVEKLRNRQVKNFSGSNDVV
jgi:pullulanase/glycogen debranching enzyme